MGSSKGKHDTRWNPEADTDKPTRLLFSTTSPFMNVGHINVY